MGLDASASNPAQVRVNLIQFLRCEGILAATLAVVLLVIFAPLALFVWKWFWLGMVLWPAWVALSWVGISRLMSLGDVCAAKVISQDPDRIAVYADLTIRADASHPAVVVMDVSLKHLTDGPVSLGDRLAVAAFYEQGDEELPDERWKCLSHVNPIRSATGDPQAIRRTMDSIAKEDWAKLDSGLIYCGNPEEEGVFFLEDGRKPGSSGVTEGRVFLVSSDDDAMEKAGAYARKTFRFFMRELSWEKRRIVPGLDVTVVKVAFSDPPESRSQNPADLEVENMWISDVEFDGRQLRGVLLNQPESLRSVHEGDSISVSPGKIVDWLYSVTGEVCGGFTVQLMRLGMDKRELVNHDNAWGMEFGSPGAVRLVPDSYLPKDVLRKRAALPGVKGMFIQGDYKAIGELEHPMSVNMRAPLDEQLSSDNSLLFETDGAGLPLLHSLTMAGSLDGVDVCLKHGADPNLKASNGTTPLMLAKKLGWKKVFRRLEQGGKR